MSNIEQDTLRNTKELDLVFSETNVGPRLQIGLSSVETEIPWETHHTLTQFFRVEEGTGILYVGPRSWDLSDGVAAIVPQGYPHRIINTGPKPLKLYSVYAKDSAIKTWDH